MRGAVRRPAMSRVLTLPATWLFYAMVVLEIVFMVSPFAIYFYSVYATPLSILDRHASTAWLTTFVLPHFSRIRASWVNVLVHRSELIFLAGLALFLVGFIQIYGAKLFTKREVTGGLYRWIRHPQYLALAIMGVGTFLHWPRYLVLLGLVLMLFTYYHLARYEEERCEERFGAHYREYRVRTGMFLPTFMLPDFRWPRIPSAPLRWTAILVLLAVSLLGAKAIGDFLQGYSISRLSRLAMADGLAISPALTESSLIDQAVALAYRQPAVQERLARAGYGSGARLLVYVVPEAWRLPDVPMEVAGGGHYTPDDFPPGKYKVLFTSVLTHQPGIEGDQVLKYSYGRVPILLIRVDLGSNQAEFLPDPPAHVRWGDIPTPLF